MLPEENRITKDYHFRRLKKHGEVVRTPFFLMNYIQNEFGVSRFGIIASSKIGNAFQRNRATRVMREVIRQHLSEVKKGYDFVFVLNRRTINTKSTIVAQVFRDTLVDRNLLTDTE